MKIGLVNVHGQKISVPCDTVLPYQEHFFLLLSFVHGYSILLNPKLKKNVFSIVLWYGLNFNSRFF